MLKTEILNPHILFPLSRIRHTNALVIADRRVSFLAGIETVDITLVDGVPRVLRALEALRGQATFDQAYMAEEFISHYSQETREQFARALTGINVDYEFHPDFKKRVPQAIGLIRTGDTIPYANMILISA
ncbi:MAG: RbsD/FucU domain-containing protein [Verrucomicrobiota bacterium]|nr:RbsD/FucU domain-containing protein [Verrucomicrobiota bacterium]